MCMVIYLASDVPLPEITWNQEAPAFNVSSELNGHDEVRRHFTKPHVYYVGSHTWCGCGFDYGQYEAEDLEEEEEVAAARASVRELASYLLRALARTETLELYSCWTGDEGEPETYRVTLSPDDFGGERFSFEERQLAIVRMNDKVRGA